MIKTKLIRWARIGLWVCVIATSASNVLAEALDTSPLPASLKMVSADEPSLQYTGRVDFKNKKAPTLSWPGTSIKARFTGNHLEILFDDQLGKNYFNVIVDGNDSHPYVIEAKQGAHRYWVSSTLGAGEHSLEIYKRTEGEEGRTAFNGLVLAADAKLMLPPKRPKRRIEIYGDSITSGMGNEAAINGADDLLSEKNHYWSYGAIAARELNAELHSISQSGIGIMVSWFPFVMPQFYDQLDAVGDNHSQWDFSQWTPHVVVINLFQNDSWLIDDHHRLVPEPNDEQRVQAYVNFVTSIRAQYPQATIICALGSMDATATDKWPNYIRAAVADLRAKGDERIETLFFPFTGYGAHPRIPHHINNAKRLVESIRKSQKW